MLTFLTLLMIVIFLADLLPLALPLSLHDDEGWVVEGDDGQSCSQTLPHEGPGAGLNTVPFSP